jgi:putative zinc finger/helix-turn-helix YgiT family protein
VNRVKRCSRCGHGELSSLTRAERRYRTDALDGVILHDVTVISCPRCNHSELAVSDIEALHHAIARVIVAKRQRLLPREIRFLRKQLRMSGIGLATHLGATPESVSRWEHGRTPMGVTADRLLRLMVAVTLGGVYPLKTLRMAARDAPRVTPIHVRWQNGAWEAMTM